MLSFSCFSANVEKL